MSKEEARKIASDLKFKLFKMTLVDCSRALRKEEYT
jgi:hypothetical protein